jgi:hypothetical protein
MALSNRLVAALVMTVALVLGGSGTRSISNSGYPDGRSDNPLSGGELSEYEILGIDAGKSVTDDEIARQFAEFKKISLRKGDPIMVIQSGALLPDEPMIRELDRYFATTPFSGVPMRTRDRARPDPVDSSRVDYARTLRLAAAKGGYEVIFCYWGVLETAVQGHATKVISWVPVIGAVIPDESQKMRVAVVDVRSGRWSMFAPETFEGSALTAAMIRRQSDQEQVSLLKETAYKNTVAAFIARYAGS